MAVLADGVLGGGAKFNDNKSLSKFENILFFGSSCKEEK